MKVRNLKRLIQNIPKKSEWLTTQGYIRLFDTKNGLRSVTYTFDTPAL